MTLIILLKPHVWEVSQVKCKNGLDQSDSRIFKLYYLKNYWSYKVDFLYAGTYLLRLQIDDVILGEHVQACQSIPNEAIKLKVV